MPMDDYLPPLSPVARLWVRFFAAVAAIVLLLWAAFSLRGVFTPLLAGLALAYIFNPVISWLETVRVRRLVSVLALYVLGVGFMLTAGVVLTGRVLTQIEELRNQFPGWVDNSTAWLRANEYLQPREWLGEWTRKIPRLPTEEDAAVMTGVPTFGPFGQVRFAFPTTAPAVTPPGDDIWLAIRSFVRTHGLSTLNTIAAFSQQAFLNVSTLLAVLVLVPMYTFFFLWRFNDIIGAIRAHLPAAYRDGIVHVAGTIDRAIADFFRGRLVVCVLIGLCAGVGWQIIGLKKGLLLGLLAGVLNLVPFMSLLALPPALLLAYTQTPPGHSWVWPVVLTMGVYLMVQALESFVLSPLIESRANGLHPITTVVALLIGAEVAGLLGMLLAIPLASTVKTLAVQFLLPELRRLATEPPPPEPIVGPPFAGPPFAGSTASISAPAASGSTLKGPVQDAHDRPKPA